MFINIQKVVAAEQEAKAILDKIVAGYKAIQANPTVEAIEARWPFAAKIAKTLGLAIPYVGGVELTGDFLATYGPEIYALVHAGGLGMTAEDTAKLRQEHIDEATANG